MPLIYQTTFELLCRLRDDGCYWKQLPRQLAKRADTWYEFATDTVFYTLSGAVDKPYLLCLLSLEVLVDKGIARIPHGCPNAVYESLSKGSWPAQLNARTDVRLPLSLERDVGGPTEVATVSLQTSSVTGKHGLVDEDEAWATAFPLSDACDGLCHRR